MNKKKFLIIATIGLLLLAPVFGALPASAQTGTKPDTIIFVTEPDTANAITRLEAGDLDIFAATISDSELFKRVKASPDLDYFKTYGSCYELTFNPAGPVFSNGKLNPFAVPRVREAMNYLINRDYIAEDILGGFGTPRWTALNAVSLDAAALASELHAIELEYAYNPFLAKQIINEQMLSLGAVSIGGVWHYNGEPVEIIVLIRIEDQRLQIGNYIADQLEGIGFAVIRDEKSAADASLIWLRGNPSEGLFHIYTGGWMTYAIPRDLGGNFAYFYTDMGRLDPLWQAYVNHPEFYELARRLDQGDFATFTERRTMMAHALDLSMADSVRIFLNDNNAFIPKQKDLNFASDLIGGMQSNLWAKTIQRSSGDSSLAYIGMPVILIDPWNAIAGSNWDYDMLPIRGTADFGLVTDPYTGLMLPDRIESAEVVIAQGHSVRKTLDWVDLDFAPEIVVPQDAWADWDAETQMFKTIAELGLGTVTAQRKSTVYYPEDLFETVIWHDGSPFSMADILMHMILTFDRAQEESPIYDQSSVAAFNSFMVNFKGVRIISEDPLTIETYSDEVNIDAEANVTTWWPYYAQGQGAWHALNLGIRAEAAGEGAFSRIKAEDAEIPWLDYVTNSVGILNDQLSAWNLNTTIPYAPTLGDYIDQVELVNRIGNLQTWYGEYGHFWIGTGPYYLESADHNPGILTLQHFLDHPDPDDKWTDFAEDPIPNVQVTGPDRFEPDQEVIYDILITKGSGAGTAQLNQERNGGRSGQPYPSKDIDRVDFFLVSDKTVYLSGQASFVEEGLWRVAIDQDTVNSLPSGIFRLEAIVVSNRVVIPASSDIGIDNYQNPIFLPVVQN